MNHPGRIETLRKLGFSEYEAKCYLALFEKESLTVNEVASLAEIPRPNAYEALRKLLARGLSVSLPGKTRKYAAANPQQFRDKSLESLSNSLKAIDTLSNDLDNLFRGSRANSSSLEYIEVIKDPRQIHRKYIQLCSDAKKEILAFTKPPYAFTTREQNKEQWDPQFEALKRGVIIRTVFEIPTNRADRASFIKWIRDAYGGEGDEAKVIESLPIKLAIFDDRIAIFVMPDPFLEKLSVTTAVVDNPTLAKTFKILFNALWRKAKDHIIINNRRVHIIDTNSRATARKKK